MRKMSGLTAVLVREKTLFCAIAVIAMGVGIHFDATELFLRYAETHEAYELDEMLWSVLCVGVVAMVVLSRARSRLAQQVALRLGAERDAAFLALHDPLTRLRNRHFLDIFLEEVEAGGNKEAPLGHFVFAVDLDGFKQVNTLIGHAGGDAILCETARRLTEIEGVELCARVGGDEFILIADRRRVPESRALAAEIVARLSEPVTVGGVTAQIGACVGIAEVPRDTASLYEAIVFADNALYASKRTGRGTITEFTMEMSTALKRRAASEAALREAIDSGAIRPHYQPLYNLGDGALIGFEALARWTRPDGCSVPPDEFIAMAEDLGLILDLSDHLLRCACADAKGWPAHLRLSFNISAVQLDDRMLTRRMMWILDATDFDPARLWIEITETTLALNLDRARQIIGEMRAMGIRIALDDFGTGYSSLAQLANFRFDAIKIDRSFISGSGACPDQREIVRAIIGLGRGLGIPLTAEGVEEREQMEWLRGIGCDVAQGYLLGRPMPAAEAARIAEELDQPVRRAAG